MLIDLSHNAIFKTPPTVIDSMRHEIGKLNITVDSLHKVVFKTEIAGDYFYQIMLLQLTVFVTIIGIGGWIGWGFFVKILNTHKEELNQSTADLVTSHSHKMNNSFKAFTSVQNQMMFNMNRSLANSASGKKDHYNAFGWGIKAIDAAFNAKKSNEIIFPIFSFAKRHLSKIEPGNIKIKTSIKIFTSVLTKGDNSEDEQIREISIEIRDLLYHIAYTIPKPPENLMEDIPNSTPTEEPPTVSPTAN